MAEDLIKRFARWLKSLSKLDGLSIPRPWNTRDTVGQKDELHVFSDASINGYGAVMYRRVVGKSGVARVVFLGGKSHVVPSNPSRVSHHNSIPRLELVAATKAAEMRGAMERSIKRRFGRVFLWTDS